MRFYLALVLSLVLLFGCTGGGQQHPPSNGTTNTTNQTQPPPVTIIIKNQTNQTVQTNITQQPPPQVNVTPINKSILYTYEPDKPLGVFFIDVGGPNEHGESVLIKKGDLNILVDAGPADNSGKVVDLLKSEGVKNIGLLISTSADPRRYGGMGAVADNFEIQQFWWSGNAFNDEQYTSIVDRMMNQTKEVDTVSGGQSVDLDGMNLSFVNPQSVPFNDINNDAIAMRLTDRNFSLLLTSDIESGAQGKLIQSPDAIKADILDAPYYGVGTGTSGIGLFLKTVNPKDAIISGSSDDSAPNGGSRMPFLRLLQEYGMNWNATYDNGTVRIDSDGSSYYISSLGQGQ